MAIKTFITSGKGGVGKSTITALLGVGLTKLNKRVLIIELDIGLKSLDVILGVENKVLFDLKDILLGRCNIDKAILSCEYAPNLKLITAPLDCFMSYNKENLAQILDELDDKYDYILIDSPAGVGTSFREVLSLIDNALIVVTPDLICVRDACSVSQILLDYGVQDQKLIINKVKNKFTKLDILPDLDYVIDQVGVQLISVILEDIDIMKFTLKGLMLPKDSQAMKFFDNLAKRILGQEVPLMVK